MFFQSEEDRKKIVRLLLDANRYLGSDPQASRDGKKWSRTWPDIQNFRDGDSIDASGLSAFARNVFTLTPNPLLKFATKYKFWFDQPSDVLAATPVFGLITVRDRYDQEQSLRAGRVWQRMHLWATVNGLAGHPVNQAVEVVDHQRSHNQEPQELRLLDELAGDPAWQPTFMFRLGYSIRDALLSPRRPIQDVVM